MPLTKKMVTTDVWTLAQERVNTLYDRFDRVAVSFSGGKDSTAALHVVLEVARVRGKLPVEAYFWDEEAIHPETVDYVRRVSQRPDVNLRWLCLPIQHRNACSKREPYWYCWAPEDEAKWCRPLPPEAITDLPGFFRRPVPECNIHVFPNRNETVAVVMGIRAAESLRRYRSVANKTVDNWLAQDSGAPDARSRGIPPEWAKAPHVTLAKPIYDWRTEDVWTAPHKFGWDYNRAYDVMQKAGITRHDQRVCPPYGEEPLRGLWQYAQCWPELWEKMIGRVPGAATAGRYCRSPMYAFGDVSKPPDLSWQEAITKELGKWPEEYRVKIAERIKAEIRWHNKNTNNAPIPDDSEKGMCWSFLYMVAVRGDFKGRKGVNYDEAAEDHGAVGSRGSLDTRFDGS